MKILREPIQKLENPTMYDDTFSQTAEEQKNKKTLTGSVCACMSGFIFFNGAALFTCHVCAILI